MLKRCELRREVHEGAIECRLEVTQVETANIRHISTESEWIRIVVANDRKEVCRGQVTLHGGPSESVLPERLECSMISDDYVAVQHPLVAEVPGATNQHTAVQGRIVVSQIIDHEVDELRWDAIGDAKRQLKRRIKRRV